MNEKKNDLFGQSGFASGWVEAFICRLFLKLYALVLPLTERFWCKDAFPDGLGYKFSGLLSTENKIFCLLSIR